MDAVVGELAERGHGVVTTGQLYEAGLTKDGVMRRVRGGRLHPLHRGVYAVGHRALTWHGRLVAAVSACGPGALASHRAAGALHGLVRSERIEVTVPRGRRGPQGVETHRSRAIGEADRAEVDGVPVTAVARTLVDLADVLPEERLVKAVHRAEILRVFDLGALRDAQARVPGRRGRHRLARVLAAYRPEPGFLRSEAERRLKQLCSRDSLPKPQFNVWIEGYELDAYWPEARLALEVDGAETHNTTHAFVADRRRDRALARRGIQVVRATWGDLGEGLTEELQEILARR